MIFRKKAPPASEGTQSEFWIPYSDLMAGLLGVFTLLLVTTLHSLSDDLNQARELLEGREEVVDVRDLLEDRRELVNQINKVFQHDPRVQVSGETGSIRFSGDILFDVGSHVLSPEGQQTLGDVMSKYMEVLLGADGLASQLAAIAIVGHADKTYSGWPGSETDPESAYKFNLGLSQRRAFSVMDFLLSDPRLARYRDDLKRLVKASGRSFMDPVYAATGEIDDNRSRRIEIDFQLRDQDLLEKVLKAVFPGQKTAAP